MPSITRPTTTNESADSTQGGNAWDSVNNTGGSTTSSSNVSGQNQSASRNETARWFGVADVVNSGLIVSIRLQYSWSVGGSLDAFVQGSGTANASYDFSIDSSLNGGGSWAGPGVSRSGSVSISGPGPANDHLNISEGASENQVIPLGTTISDIQVRSSLSSSASTGAADDTVTADADPSCSISDIQVVVTLADGRIITMM